MKPYGQFCPIAKAAEILEERWTLLIVRELLLGSRHFNQLRSGVPRISRSVLAARLRSLQRSGLVVRHAGAGGRRTAYELTPAGRELYPIIMQIGEWGQRWVNHDIGPSDVDTDLLMWDMHRRIHLDRLPEARVVVQVDFVGASRDHYWLVLERPEPSLCLHDPGFEIDLLVTADALSLHRVWIGRLPIADALRDRLLEIDGPADLRRAFPGWLRLSTFAHIPPASPAAGLNAAP